MEAASGIYIERKCEKNFQIETYLLFPPTHPEKKNFHSIKEEFASIQLINENNFNSRKETYLFSTCTINFQKNIINL